VRHNSRSDPQFPARLGANFLTFTGMSSPLASRLSSPLTKVSAAVACLALASAFTAAPARSSGSDARTLGGDGCNHQAPDVRNPQGSSVRVGTFNIRAGVGASRFAAGVKALLPDVDIAGLQEVNSKEKAKKLAAIKRSGPWDFWRQYRTNIPQHPHEGGAEQNPVMWRGDRFVCTYAGPMLASGLISLKGELPKWDDDKRHWFSVVHLVDRVTGQRLSIVNVHMIHGAVKGGTPAKGEPLHWDVYVTQMTNLIEKVENQRGYGTVYVMGDFNCGWVADEKHRHAHMPFRSFGGIDFRSMWATERPDNGKGTHEDALIDQVFAHDRADSAKVLFGLSEYSDHVPAVARYSLPAAN
jgi:endonuclease/exonuclease/phosphatase family metal-dependent hydrolase